ncbi:cupredoxin domain-containing protein [Tepidiforma sp.]|uniref:cupredoxin domain-containing protein n=1 Tax=Tepidiforma sp. TaxID=2682230 RepID=UPI002ADDD311|nr:cupredoxin domain-containing protein [Tepidiforma sp.]
MKTKRTALLLSVAGAILTIAAACSGGGGSSRAPAPIVTATQGAPQAAEQTATPSAGSTATQIDFSSPSGIDGADPEFNYSAMVWQGYWLSRDHFGPLAMGSGMGIPFEPPMEMVTAAMQMVGSKEPGMPFLPENILPLQAVFRSGDTALTADMTTFSPTDFRALRLDPSTFDTVVGVEGQAQLMLKESQWARNFHTASHFGTPESDFGAQQRFLGMMVSMLAQMQGQYAMTTLMDPGTGLYRDSDGRLDYRGNWTMLQALADIAGLTGDQSLRYYNPDSHTMFAMAVGRLFTALGDRKPETADEFASAMRALSYVAWTADDQALRSGALDRIARIAADWTDVKRADGGPAERSAAIVGLLTAVHATGESGLLGAVKTHWEALAADFDPKTGTFKSKTVYSVDDVAWIIGGLNSLVQVGPAELRAPAAKALVAFYEATLDQSGLQLSAPPGKDGAMAGEFEKDLPSIVYYHGRNTPPPPMAGGKFGRLMLPASEIAFEGGKWTVTNTRFESAGGMHLANELNWLGPHLGSVPFPPLRSEQTPAGATPAAGTRATITAKNVAFDTALLEVPVGQQVQVRFVNSDGETPHNFHISGPGGFDAKTPIFKQSDGGSRELTFTLTTPGEYTFVCDVHPNQMKGKIIAR